MPFSPNIDKFRNLYESGQPQLVWEEISTDVATPVSAILRLKDEHPYHLLYESVEGGRRARYSIIAVDPDQIWRCVDGRPQINKDVKKNADNFENCSEDIFTSLRKFINDAKVDIPNDLPPMAAGIFGYMGYDMVHYMENIPTKNPDTLGIPEAVYFRPQVVIVFDSMKDCALIITTARVCDEDAQSSYDAAVNRIENIKQQLNQEPKKQVQDEVNIGPFEAHVDESLYADFVKKGVEYVYSGDICQVVPSRRWEGDFSLPAICLYRSLRNLNPSPYLFYLNIENFSLVGSSPEILVRLKDDKVTIRPLAGTRKRGADDNEDKSLEEELLADEKELSEHLMLLDLGRNDVGRVAQPASVEVTEMMTVEKYSHVMHIVSNVEGKIDKNKDAIDALIAGFPAGTLTGAPKIRAMEIIEELESEKRGFYGGTVGYFSANGEMDTCIAIRTGLVKDGKLYIQAGGGIVADSVESDEIAETENKAKAIMNAASMSEKFI